MIAFKVKQLSLQAICVPGSTGSDLATFCVFRAELSPLPIIQRTIDSVSLIVVTSGFQPTPGHGAGPVSCADQALIAVYPCHTVYATKRRGATVTGSFAQGVRVAQESGPRRPGPGPGRGDSRRVQVHRKQRNIPSEPKKES
jgi:hypothetical protein